jgi:hypothetical protein
MNQKPYHHKRKIETRCADQDGNNNPNLSLIAGIRFVLLVHFSSFLLSSINAALIPCFQSRRHLEHSLPDL